MWSLSQIIKRSGVNTIHVNIFILLVREIYMDPTILKMDPHKTVGVTWISIEEKAIVIHMNFFLNLQPHIIYYLSLQI